MGLITETNAQYYAGQQILGNKTSAAGANLVLTGWSFNTDPVSAFGLPEVGATPTKSLTQVSAASNFDIYFAPTATPNTYAKISQNLVYVSNTSSKEITIIAPDTTNTDYSGNFYFQLTQPARNDNHGSYEYITLNDIINNFIVAYIGVGKLIPNVKRTDVMFHAKRGLQEFSYDTLKSIKSQELTVPPSLSVIIPQDYVNYVSVSWIDQLGIKRPIYPANNLTTSPYETPIQDQLGIPTNDNFGENIEGTSLTEERWKRANDNLLNGQLGNNVDQAIDFQNQFGFEGSWNWGRQYGLDPQLAQTNGWFNINEREGKMSFSSNLVGKLIVLEYISDGLAYELDTRVPKMAEDAMYAYVVHAILSTRVNQPEYIVQRLQKDKRAKLRNAKIRLSNIKLDEIVQVMRGKSKWIKS